MAMVDPDTIGHICIIIPIKCTTVYEMYIHYLFDKQSIPRLLGGNSAKVGLGQVNDIKEKLAS